MQETCEISGRVHIMFSVRSRKIEAQVMGKPLTKDLSLSQRQLTTDLHGNYKSAYN